MKGCGSKCFASVPGLFQSRIFRKPLKWSLAPMLSCRIWNASWMRLKNLSGCSPESHVLRPLGAHAPTRPFPTARRADPCSVSSSKPSRDKVIMPPNPRGCPFSAMRPNQGPPPPASANPRASIVSRAVNPRSACPPGNPRRHDLQQTISDLRLLLLFLICVKGVNLCLKSMPCKDRRCRSTRLA